MRNKQPSCKDADSSRLAQDKERKGSLIMTAIIIEAIVLVQTSVVRMNKTTILNLDPCFASLASLPASISFSAHVSNIRFFYRWHFRVQTRTVNPTTRIHARAGLICYGSTTDVSPLWSVKKLSETCCLISVLDQAYCRLDYSTCCVLGSIVKTWTDRERAKT